MEFTTVEILAEREVCDGTDVDVLIDDTYNHIFHFAASKVYPTNLQARVEELVALLPPFDYELEDI